MDNIIDEVVRAGLIISKGLDIKLFIASLIDQLFDVTGSDIACFYSRSEERVRLLYRRGKFSAPDRFSPREDPFSFVIESNETVVLTERKKSPFLKTLLHDSMNSGVVAPIGTSKNVYGFVVLNSQKNLFFTRTRFMGAEALTKLAGEYFHNSLLHNQLKEYTRKIEALERYQKNIFSSMTNILLTADIDGSLKYFNPAAEERFSLTSDHIGKPVKDIFSNRLGKNMLGIVNNSISEGKQIVGAEGIFRGDESDIDFSLNTSPLLTSRGKREGLTLIFTDQSRERELQKQVKKVKEERRLIKDMFSRYLSESVVSKLVKDPNIINLGGDKKDATVFFADIRGYTSFSEGKDPEYIISVLNDYFSEAVEIIIESGGFIDKFIGDCIMAAWGVPLMTAEEDARLAVSTALQIQKEVNNPNRKFFRDEASGLKIGIGIHSGPLVAGNLGSERRIDYTVIGDTVNIASRLEGVAGPDEVIITENTKGLLGGKFKLERRTPVKVKGKKQPLNIYKVLKKVG
ncbi:MAG: PAS domain-containing protein [Spirochaetota bacterium]|nr:MAG: PAS domain-containing protein [Spirochaetota bacterium]